MVERRRHRRLRLDMLQVNGRLTFASEVTLLNICIGGVSLKADQRLNVGGKYVLKLEDSGKLVSAKGVVVWSRLTGTRSGQAGEVVPLYTAGMKFVDLSEENVARLLSILEHNEREEMPAPGDRRQHVRFHIKTPGKPILSFPADYSVITMSAGGMLIESDHALEIESAIPMELSLSTKRSVNFSGRVVSSRMTDREGKSRYESGIEFIGLNDEGKEVIASFIDYLLI